MLPNGKVVPGFLRKCSARNDRSLQLSLQPGLLPTGGHRLLARRGSSVQEVIVSTTAERHFLEAAAQLACMNHHPKRERNLLFNKKFALVRVPSARRRSR